MHFEMTGFSELSWCGSRFSVINYFFLLARQL